MEDTNMMEEELKLKRNGCIIAAVATATILTLLTFLTLFILDWLKFIDIF